MATEITYCDPSGAIPCTHCERQPEAWLDSFGYNVMCLCRVYGYGARGAINYPTLPEAVEKWNCMNEDKAKTK